MEGNEDYINTSNLTEGLIVNNYNQLCELLEEKPKGGNSKKSQLKDWKRYFDYDNSGYKFIIKQIYTEPKAKPASNALYVRFIELLLMYELSTKDNYTCNYTKTNLFKLLGMINSNYLKRNRHLAKDKITEIPKWQVNHFYQRSSKKLTEILFSAMNSMKRRKLLRYFEQYIICKNYECRVANKFEEKWILTVERDVLLDMGYERVPFWKIEEYYSMVNAKLNELYGWDLYAQWEI